MGCLKLTHNQQPALRVVHGKKAVTSNDWVKRVRSSYPFGMLMPGRHDEINGRTYAYGFGGHERDDEIKGSGNHLSFGNYGYDPRLGRRWQIDPVETIGESGYATFHNNPNFYKDPDGESPISIFVKAVAKAGLKKAAKEFVEAQIKKRVTAYSSKAWGKQLFKDALDILLMLLHLQLGMIG